MDSLPHEILVHIFQYLPLSSRKRVRSVNKKWNNACCDPLIVKRERFKISEKYYHYMNEFFGTLVATNRTIINLKFSDFHEANIFSEEEKSGDFWRNHGTKVRSLEFGSSCYIEESMLFTILTCCPNVNEFSALILLYRLDNLLELLLDNNVILKKVTFLGIREFYLDETCVNIYEILPKVFPNVQKLNICPIYNICEGNSQLLDIFCPAWDYVFTLSSNLQYLELGYSRKIIHDPSDLRELNRLTNVLAAIRQIETLKLSEVDILSRFHVIQLRNLKNLSTLCFNAKDTTLSACELILEMLNNLPKLRYLEITEASAFGWNNNVVEKLVTSSLETLKIMKTAGLNDELYVMVNNNSKNNTLENLVIELFDGSIPESICLFFVKYFRKLRALSFGENVTSRNVLENLRIHQTNLYSLTITIKAENYLRWDTSGRQVFSFRQFKYLEELNLKIISFFGYQFSFSNFVLPRLKYLKVQFDGLSNYDHINPMNLVNFLHAIEKLPCLESLKLLGYCEEIPKNSILRLCGSLKNLKRLYFRGKTGSSFINKRSVERIAELSNLFGVRESLRFISDENRCVYKNIITQETIFDI